MVVLSFAISKAYAQTVSPGPTQIWVNGKPTAPTKGCQANQMRCVNNAMRKVAAKRNADRRAKWLKTHIGGN